MNSIKPQSIQLIIIVSLLLMGLMVIQKTQAKGLTEKQMQSVLKQPQVTINNIDIKNIDADLLALYPLSCDVWSGFEFEVCLELENNQVFFSVTGDYDYDGLTEQYQTGYAQFESGQWAKYLLVLNHQLDVIAFKTILLDGLNDYYNFTGIFKSGGQLHWVECNSCDVIYTIRVFDGESHDELAVIE